MRTAIRRLCLFITAALVAAGAPPTSFAESPASQVVAQSAVPAGYWLVTAAGQVLRFGNAAALPASGGPGSAAIVAGIASAPDGGGYFLARSDGIVRTFGDATGGRATGLSHVVGIAVDAATGGYWVVSSTGQVVATGAPPHGSVAPAQLSAPVVGIAATRDGGGYYVVTSTGRIFTFGDARYLGSTASVHLNKPVVAMAIDRSSGGYWLFASDGGVFQFGGARYLGSLGYIKLNRPILGAAGTLFGAGYYMVASDGGVFHFGNGVDAGSAGSMNLSSPVTAMVLPATMCASPAAQVAGDPYAPSCHYFPAAGNGGATSRGVSATTITVTVRETDDASFQQTLAQVAGAQLSDTNADNERTISALATYFNEHFQLYGRKIVIRYFHGNGQLTNEIQGLGQTQANTDAAIATQQYGAFADLTAESEHYATALAHDGVMAFGDPYLSSAWHRQHAPFGWSTDTDSSTIALGAANYTLKRLCPSGTPARYAGGSLKNTPRKFAVIAPDVSSYVGIAAYVQQALQSGGCGSVKTMLYTLDLTKYSNQAASIVSQLKADGVTTVICASDPILLLYLSGEAVRQTYLPEVIDTGILEDAADYVGQLWRPEFAAHVLGLSPESPATSPTNNPGYAAYHAVRPQDSPAFFVEQIFRQMEMMAIGIEMAGPHLTPANFQSGMRSYPSRQGSQGLWAFPSDIYTTPRDVREICWSNTAASAVNGKLGAFVGTSNARWQPNSIPAGAPGCPVPA